MGIERRLHPRFEFMAQVRVKRGRVDLLMDLTNISRSGALVDMGSLTPPAWVADGRVVEIGIIHPVDLDTIEVRGEIVRIQKGDDVTRFAVHFVEVGEETVAGLERLLEAAKASAPTPPPLPKAPPPLPK